MELYQYWADASAQRHVEKLDSDFQIARDRLKASFKYVALRPDHAEVSSTEFASVLADSAVAFSTFSSAMYRVHFGNANRLSIDDFHRLYEELLPGLPCMYTDLLDVPKHRYRLQPFWGWNGRANSGLDSRAPTPPTWWTANNKLKHPDDDKAWRHGNLRHATHAVGALFIVLRRASQMQRGSGIFHEAGNPWRPGDPGTEHIDRFFDPTRV